MKKLFKGLAAAVSMALLMAPAVSHAETKTETEVQNKVVGYFADWDIYARNFQAADIDASKLTHINYAFATITDGTIQMGDPWADIQNPYLKGLENSTMKGSFGQLVQLKEQHPGLKTLISVGGWSMSGGFSDVALTDQSRAKFADSVVTFLRDYQFDGVDLDWEYPVGGGMDTNVTRPEDKQNYTLLLQTIREKLNQAGKKDHKKYLLTIAGGASASFVKNTELEKIDTIVDWINIMTYDFHGSWETVSGNDAPLYSTSGLDANTSVKAYEKAGVHANKIVMGVPFYGKGWDGCAPVNHGEFQQCSGPSNTGTWENAFYDYTDLENNYIGKNGFQTFWDDKEKEPFLYKASTGTFITYENAKSVRYKAEYITNQGLGGAMVWEISGDRNKTLFNVLADELLDN